MLSVVVPVYNVEKYLRESLESLHIQKTHDVEFLIVNDGSTDNSQTIIDEFVKKDNRFKSYIKENGGVSEARNYVLPHVKGDYIFYFDSDDILTENALEKINNALTKKPDCVVFDLKFFWEGTKDTKIVKGVNKNLDNKIKAILLSTPSASNKIFKKEILEKNMFPSGLFYEDLATTPIMIAQCESFEYIDEPIYLYRQRKGSIIYTFSDKAKDIYIDLKRVINYYKSKNLFDEYYDELEYLCIEHLLLNGNRRFYYSDQHDELFKKSKEFVESYFDKCLQNKYYKEMSINDKLFIKLAYHCNYSLLRLLISVKGLIK